MLTTVHVPFDGRIFHKEAKSLARAGYDVVLIARHTKAETIDGVRIVPVPEPRSRFRRMTSVTWKLYRQAVREDADVYHFHDPELMIVGLLLKVRGKKVVWDVHEHYPTASSTSSGFQRACGVVSASRSTSLSGRWCGSSTW